MKPDSCKPEDYEWSWPTPIRMAGVAPTGIRFAGCPTCGDSLQTVETQVPDHDTWHTLYVAWCMDCRDIKGYIVLPRPTKA